MCCRHLVRGQSVGDFAWCRSRQSLRVVHAGHDLGSFSFIFIFLFRQGLGDFPEEKEVRERRRGE
jgi:hypothetical protein